MKRILFGTAALLALGACASTPAANSPANAILGTWSCKAEADSVTTVADVTYLEGGKATMKAKVGVNQNGMQIDIDATGDATWKFLDDGKLLETITGMKVISGKMGGRDVPVAMIQPMVEQMVVNQSSTSTAVITPTTLTSTDEDGVVTRCTR